MLHNPICHFSYHRFIAWNYIIKIKIRSHKRFVWYHVGIFVNLYSIISKIFIKSNLEVQVILSNKDDTVIEKIRKSGYGVTAIEVKGAKDTKYMLYIQIKNRSFEHLKKIIKQLDKSAFIVVNETKYVENGYFNIEK